MTHPALQLAGDLLGIARRTFVLVALVALVVAGLFWLRHHDGDVRAAARFAYVTDSLQRAQSAFQQQAELLAERADSAIAVADSLAQLHEEAPRVLERLVAAAPLPRPAITGDTVTFADSIPHVVDRPVAQWMLAAAQHITHLEAAIRDTITPAWNALLGERNALRTAVGELQGANANLDSLATARLLESKALRRELARQRSSTLERIGTWLIRGLALKGAIDLVAVRR